MLALAPHLVARLQALPALTGWAVRDELALQARSAMPSATIACIGATVSPGQRAGMLEPRWQITLAVPRAQAASTELDAAMEAVIGALIGWMAPPDANARRWEPLRLFSALPPNEPTEGVAAYVLTFTTAGLYRGQD